MRTFVAFLLEPLLAGLSTGLFCCFSCVPVLAPVFAAEARSARATYRIWLEFLGGRLLGYLLLGAAAGWLGERFGASVLHRISAVAMIVLALVLIAYALGLRNPAAAGCGAGSPRGRKTPFLLGLLLATNACPPLWLSVAYVFTLHDGLRGLAYFLVFFAATTVYLVPLLFVGGLGRWPEFRRAARFSALAVGVLFFVHGILKW
ncbi:MAG: sulfite exporter TauE/SafE family protein [Kiritimatiellia bacterium]